MAKAVKTVAMRQLDALGVPYKAVWQEEATFHAEDAAQARGLPLSRVVKSLLVVAPGRKYYLALVQGDRMLSLHKLATVLGMKGLSMARHDEVAAITGYEPGSVSPLGLKKRIAVVMDEHILAEELVSISGGKHTLGLELNPADLMRATGARSADITQ
jgi:Cys-tRNA(Pro)/Cys-tRNA(Cys) deacylase